MVGDDAVVMRILIQDDGKPLPPGSDATQSGGGGGGHYAPSTAVHPQAQVGQPAGASQTAGFAGPSAGSSARADFTSGATGQRASSGNAWVDAAARRAGIDPELLKLLRSASGPGVPSAVRSAEPTVTVNEAAGPRINQPVTGGRVPGATGGAYAAGAGAGPEPIPSVTAAGTGWVSQAGSFLRGLGAAGVAAVAAAGVAAVGLVDSQVRNIGERSRASTARFAGAASGLARNDVVGAAGQYAEGTAEVLEIMPLVGTAMGQLIRSSNAVVQAFDSTTRAFIDRGRELARYSPDAAMAAGRQTVRDVRSDIREANYLGSSYANVSDQYGELIATLKEILLPIKKFLLGALGTTLEVLNTFLATIQPFIEAFGKAANLFVEIYSWHPLAIVGGYLKKGYDTLMSTAKAILEWLGLKDEEKDVLQKFFDDAEAQFMKGDGRRQAGGFDNARMDLGAFGRL